MKSYLRLCLLLPVVILFTACASTQTATKAPTTNLSELKTFYVVMLEKDDRGVHELIANQLTTLGRTATSGVAPTSPVPVDAIVTYQDKWMWDITMYMLQLEVQLRHPTTNMVLASGSSMRTSLKRKSPEGMVTEVVTQIFAQ